MNTTRGLAFEARSSPGLRYWVITLGAILGAMALVSAILAALPNAVSRFASLPLGLVVMAVNVIAVMRGANGRAVRVEVDGDRLLVDGGAGGTFPLASARIGRWRMPMLGTADSTLIELSGGGRTLRLLGLGHELPRDAALSMQADQPYDARISSSEMQALLELLPRAAQAVERRGPPAATLRFELFVHPGALSRGFSVMGPWMATIAITLLFTGVLQATPLGDSRYGQYVVGVVDLLIAVTGIVVTARRATRRRPEREIEIGPVEVTLRDAVTRRALYTCPTSGLGGTRAMHRWTGRRGSFEHACVQIRLPGRADLTVGVWDPRYAWTDATPWLGPTPDYVVSATDWEALVSRLALAPWMRKLTRGATP
jgi:hypothetical protein